MTEFEITEIGDYVTADGRRAVISCKEPLLYPWRGMIVGESKTRTWASNGYTLTNGAVIVGFWNEQDRNRDNMAFEFMKAFISNPNAQITCANSAALSVYKIADAMIKCKDVKND